MKSLKSQIAVQRIFGKKYLEKNTHCVREEFFKDEDFDETTLLVIYLSKKEKKSKIDSEPEPILIETNDDASVVLQEEKEENLLIPRDDYLASGVHIGTKLKTKHSEKWIYRTTSYGLYVLNLLETDRRIRIAGKFLASFEPERIMVCSVRRYGRNPVRKFCEVTGSKAFADRFIPGTLTNPLIDQFHEADVLLMIDPHADKQALSEAKLARIPVVSFIDTDDYLYDIDLAIPANNRGRKSLCRMLWLLARQTMRERGKIPPDGDIDLTVNDFESKISRPEPEA